VAAGRLKLSLAKGAAALSFQYLQVQYKFGFRPVSASLAIKLLDLETPRF
jgi:hypothetical protein